MTDTSKKKRRIVGYSLPPEVIEAVESEKARTDVPSSRIVERAIRAYLGLDSQGEKEA